MRRYLRHLPVRWWHVLDQGREQLALLSDVVGLDLVAVVELDPDLLVAVDQRDLGGLAVLNGRDDGRGVLRLVAPRRRHHLRQHEGEHDDDDDPEDRSTDDALDVHGEGAGALDLLDRGRLGVRRYTAAVTAAPTGTAVGPAFAASDHPPGR